MKIHNTFATYKPGKELNADKLIDCFKSALDISSQRLNFGILNSSLTKKKIGIEIEFRKSIDGKLNKGKLKKVLDTFSKKIADCDLGENSNLGTIGLYANKYADSIGKEKNNRHKLIKNYRLRSKNFFKKEKGIIFDKIKKLNKHNKHINDNLRKHLDDVSTSKEEITQYENKLVVLENSFKNNESDLYKKINNCDDKDIVVEWLWDIDYLHDFEEKLNKERNDYDKNLEEYNRIRELEPHIRIYLTLPGSRKHPDIEINKIEEKFNNISALIKDHEDIIKNKYSDIYTKVMSMEKGDRLNFIRNTLKLMSVKNDIRIEEQWVGKNEKEIEFFKNKMDENKKEKATLLKNWKKTVSEKYTIYQENVNIPTMKKEFNRDFGL